MSDLWHGRAIVHGPPRRMGDKRAGLSKSGKAFVYDQGGKQLRSWQAELRASMRESAPPAPLNTSISVQMTVFVARPLSHYGTGARSDRLKTTAPRFPESGLDLDKVERAALDCGTGIWWVNDARVAQVVKERLFADDGEGERTVIAAREMTEAYAVAGIWCGRGQLRLMEMTG